MKPSMAGSIPGYGRFFIDTHGTERTKRTEPSRQDYEPLPVKRTVKKYKIFPATSSVLLLVAFRDGGAYKILD